MQMKQFKAGDYVRFINEKQEGTISKILPSGNVIVDIEDGFPIEVTPREIVKVQENLIEKIQQEQQQQTPAENHHEGFPAPDAFRIKDEIRLLIIPAYGKVTTGTVNVYLLNMTSNSFLFTFSEVRNRQHKGLWSGKADPQECIFLSEFRREDLIDKQAFILIGLQHSNMEHHPFPVIRKEFDLPVPDLHQRFPFLLSQYAFTQTVTIVSEQRIEEEDQTALFEKLKGEFATVKKAVDQTKERNPKKGSEKEQDYLRKFGLSSGDVDLHIEELTSDISGMSNSEIIQIQLSHFRKELDKAILRKARQLVLIHGVGNGRLKSEIRKELKEAGIRFRDADQSRYGLGATEVLF